MTDSFNSILEYAVAFRHQLHQCPEPGNHEHKTAEAIRTELKKLGLNPLPPFMETDVVLIVEGNKGPGKNVTLRADIDALRITENTNLPYASQIPGMMHACGHDGHAAMLLAAAKILAAKRNDFAGSVRFVWQPGEEHYQLGKDLVEKGVLENPHADYVACLHGMPGLETGLLGIRDGASEASCVHFTINIKGKGGHSSRPHLAKDPILAASALVVELQSIVSRRIDPLNNGVLSICTFNGGTQSNAIPDEVTLSGTARALGDETDQLLKDHLVKITKLMADIYETENQVVFNACYPVTYNTPKATALARKVIGSMKDGSVLYERPTPAMSADDFAYYTQKHEGVYVKLGLGNISGLHTNTFDFTDEAMENGIQFLVDFALEGLK